MSNSTRGLAAPLVLGLVLSPFAFGCSKSAPAPETDPAPEAPAGEPADSLTSQVTSSMDQSVNPCDDFYRYACGGWLDATEVPGDRASWSRGFDVIWEQNRSVMRTILEDEAQGESLSAEHTQLVDYYASCSDTEAINNRGLEPLNALLASVDAVTDMNQLMATTADLHMIDVDIFFSLFVGADYKNPDQNILALFQGGMGLPERDYYLSEDPNIEGLRQAYKGHIAQMMMHLGSDEATAASQADQIMAFETELAKLAMPMTEFRDPEKRYHMKPVAELKAMNPELNFDVYFEKAGLGTPEMLNVATPGFIDGIGALMAATPMDQLKTYVKWQTLHGTANLLSKEIDDTNFAFFGQMLQGRKEQAERWKRCTTATGFALGDSMSKLFVEREFAGDSKAMSLAMIKGIEDAFAAGLPGNEWMDDETRARALEKMEAISNKIGYPNEWKDYSSIAVDSGTYFENALNVRRFNSDEVIAKLSKPVDPNEWFMPAFLVNAYYNPSENEIVFPAGILQAPFFDAEHPAAMNFGGIGMVMGHELTHGFDDGGRKFDGEGKMVEWWAPEVIERFETAAKCVEDQYNGFEVQEGLNVNGKLTLGENIADLGGVKQSYEAWKAYVAVNGPGGKVEGLTDEQLFFVGFAQAWCTKTTPEMEEVLVRTDSHSPSRFRVNGPLMNYPVFAETFSCEEGAPMRPAEICTVW